MSGSDRAPVGKIEQWARWTLWPAGFLTVVGLAMLYTGVSNKAWQWFLPIYLLVGTPIIIESFLCDVTRLRSLWRSRKGADND
jgi:hypothetical protein